MRTLILCGGRGMRAYPYTEEVPKPLLEVAGRPILEHLMGIFAAQGHDDFVLAAGYRSEMITSFARSLPADWRVDVVDTGERTDKAARILACRDVVGPEFFVTYADALADIDLGALLRFHRGSGALAATVTTVPLPSPYGTLEVGGAGEVSGFHEKPTLHDHLINAGFFVMRDAVFDAWAGDDLEAEVLPKLAADGALYAFRHEGFWKSMDTYKDALELSRLCEDPPPPWDRFSG